MKLRRICKHNYAQRLTVLPKDDGIKVLYALKIFVKMKNILDTSKNCGIIRLSYSAALMEVQMAKPRPPKEKYLQDSGALNTHPVTDPLFRDSDFFDPRDLVQVKYEMLRKVHKEHQPVSQAAASFGFSRPSWYKILAAFESQGIAGLLPRKRGPRRGHKLTEEVLGFIQELCTLEQPMGTAAILEKLEKRFGIRVHRRSLERALRRYEKKTPPSLEPQKRKSP